MWWSRAALVLALAALGPVACGFRPLYGTSSQSAYGGQVAEALAGIRVRGIEDRHGQMLRNALVQRLTPRGEPAKPRYDLTVKIQTSLEGLGQQKDALSTLGRMVVTATYDLREPGTDERDGTSITSGNTRSVVSFNYLGPRYASVAMERDAEGRAIEEIAENIRRQLAVRLAKGPEASDR